MQFSKLLTVFIIGSTSIIAAPTSNEANPSPVEKRTIPPYGTNVDGADTTAPDGTIYPPALPSRGPTSLTASGNYKPYCTGCLGGTYELFYEGTYVTITGSGYISVNWEIGYGNSPGQIRPPSWTGLTGKLWHVASGGGHRMDDTRLNCGTGGCCTGQSWFGCPGTEYYDTLPSGATQMWQIEYYYLEDGSVTLHDNENAVDYNLGVSFPDWATIDADIRKTGNKYDLYNPVLRYGIVRDGGNDDTPVPQYLTRDSPSDPSTVAQQSVVS